MKITVLIALTFLSISQAIAFGVGDWQRNTPYGNSMYDNGGGAAFFLVKTGQEITAVKRWYFYKGYTVGEYQQGYFLVEEGSARLQRFASSKAWENELTRRNLKPVWTRWYQDDWHLLDDLLLVMVLAFYISIPVLIMFLVAIFRSIREERLNPRKPYTLVLIGVCVLLSMQYYFETNPVSL